MSRRMTKVVIAIIVIVFLAVLFITGLPFRLMGNFLLVKDNVSKADAILVLSGEAGGEREQKGVELYNSRMADKIIMSGGIVGWNTTQASIMKEHALFLGVDEKDIITEDKSETTYENALYSKKIIEDRGYKSIILVTSSYHMKRSLYIHRKVFKGTGVTIYHATSEVPYFTPKTWWKNDKGIKSVSMEYLKFFWYLAKY